MVSAACKPQKPGWFLCMQAIVFSQFWMHLQLIAATLTAAGVNHSMLQARAAFVASGVVPIIASARQRNVAAAVQHSLSCCRQACVHFLFVRTIACVCWCKVAATVQQSLFSWFKFGFCFVVQAHMKPDAKAAALASFQDDPRCSESRLSVSVCLLPGHLPLLSHVVIPDLPGLVGPAPFV